MAKKYDNEILKMFQPKKYDGSDGIEVQSIKLFNTLCTVLEQFGVSEPKKLTAFEFYHKLDLIEDQAKQQKKKWQ